MGARDGKLSMIKTYRDALLHHMAFGTPKTFLKDLVKAMAVQKGLPKRVGVKEAEEFSGGYNGACRGRILKILEEGSPIWPLLGLR